MESKNFAYVEYNADDSDEDDDEEEEEEEQDYDDNFLSKNYNYSDLAENAKNLLKIVKIKFFLSKQMRNRDEEYINLLNSIIWSRDVDWKQKIKNHFFNKINRFYLIISKSLRLGDRRGHERRQLRHLRLFSRL